MPRGGISNFTPKFDPESGSSLPGEWQLEQVLASFSPRAICAAVPATQSQRRQLQTGDPAFGAFVQSGEVIGGQAQPHRLIEKRSHFVSAEKQVVGSQFDQLIPRANGQSAAADPIGWYNHMHVRRRCMTPKVEPIRRVSLRVTTIPQCATTG